MPWRCKSHVDLSLLHGVILFLFCTDCISLFFAYINLRYLKLPPTIGVMEIAMVVSILLVITGNIFPKTLDRFSTLLVSVDFTEVLMGAILNFLLFGRCHTYQPAGPARTTLAHFAH
jgi:hypothetical protein